MDNQIPQQAIQGTQSPSVKKSRKRLIVLVIIGIIALTVIPLIVFYGRYLYEILGIYKTQAKVAVDMENPLRVPSFKYTKLATSEWKTFAGKNIGVSFKYPQNWEEVDSENVSQAPVKEVFENKDWAYSNGEKIGNTIWVKKYSKAVDPISFSEILKYYEKMDTTAKNIVIEDLEQDSGAYLEKINESKTAEGKEYLTFVRYSWDYKSMRDPNASEGEREIDWKILNTYIKEGNTIYELTLGYYDDTGANIYTNIIQTVNISNNPIPNKKFENSYISLEYPPYARFDDTLTANEVAGKNERFTFYPVDNSDNFSPVMIRAVYIDPSVYGNGSYKTKGSWWYQAICKYIGDGWFNKKFSYINGYPSITIHEDFDTNTDEEVFLMNKPYIVRLTTEEKESIPYLNNLASSLKYKAPLGKVEPEMVSYLQNPPVNNQSELICGNDISIMGF